MKPILNRVQTTLIEDLKRSNQWPESLTILPGNAWTLSQQMPSAETLKPLKLYVYTPFPMQMAHDLAVPTWEKLSLQCVLTQSWLQESAEDFLDLAEKISLHLSHKNFATPDWEGCFIMDENEPWRWQTMENGLALQMHFITSQFNPIPE